MGTGSNISHLTHLSGMLIGYLYLRFGDHWRTMIFNVRKRIVELNTSRKTKTKHNNIKLQQEVDHILDKANICGFESLSDEEQQKLYSASRKLSNKQQKD